MHVKILIFILLKQIGTRDLNHTHSELYLVSKTSKASGVHPADPRRKAGLRQCARSTWNPDDIPHSKSLGRGCAFPCFLA